MKRCYYKGVCEYKILIIGEMKGLKERWGCKYHKDCWGQTHKIEDKEIKEMSDKKKKEVYLQGKCDGCGKQFKSCDDLVGKVGPNQDKFYHRDCLPKKELTIDRGRMLHAALKCEGFKRVAKDLWPEEFEPEKRNVTYEVTVETDYDQNSGSMQLKLMHHKELVGYINPKGELVLMSRYEIRKRPGDYDTYIEIWDNGDE